MWQFKQALTALAGAYEKAQGEDYIKFLFQGAFGSGHFIADDASALARLEREWENAQETAPLLEQVSDKYFRLHLGAAKRAGLSPRTVLSLFTLAAKTPGEEQMQLFKEQLELLKALAAGGEIPLDANALKTKIDAYAAAGYPPQSHSEAYRQAYSPSYRIIGADAALFLPLFCHIDGALARGESLSLAIEGGSASGKTTLSKLLSDVYGCEVVHMDDFFLQKAQRTPQRLAEVGGNVDYERFLQEVTPFIAGESEFSYRPYNCHTFAYDEARTLPQSPLRVVEGCYALHPKLSGVYNCRVFLHTGAAAQSARILARSGAEMHTRFMGEWVPKENAYFEWAGTRSQCDFVFCTESL